MTTAQAVDVSDALAICQTLENLVKKSFGPNALSTLLSSSSGTICITNDGVAVLQSLNFKHPIGKIILDSVISHHQLVGDNSKAFIFILTELLREISQNLNTPERASTIFKLRDAFARLNADVLQTTVLQALQQHARVHKDDAKNMEDICRHLAQTSMASKFNLHTQRILSDLVVQLVTRHCQNIQQLNQLMCELIDDFADLFLKISGQAVTMSRLIPGMVIQKDFCVHFNESCDTKMKFILLKCSLEDIVPQSNATIFLKEQSQVTKAFTYLSTSLERRLKVLRDRGITLVLSTDQFSDTAKHLCSQYKISVVHLLSEDDVDRISRLTRVVINADIDDRITDASIGDIRCERIIIGSKAFVNLVPNLVQTHQVVICAPSPGLVTEYIRAFGNTIKVLRMWTEDASTFSNESSCSGPQGTKKNPNCQQPLQKSTSHFPTVRQTCFVTLPGGGATEIIVSKTLTDYAADHKNDPYLSLAASIMAKAVLNIPHILHCNSFSSRTRDNWMVLLNEAINNVKTKNEMISVDGKSGKLIGGFEVGLVVSLTSKMRMYTDILQLLQSLLKIDAVVF
ncbi:T-complex protein 1 subunit theta-like [Anneissia japonica]|uniref:T-complex protein 1 subunit theta-like n=1 Tax=Anneissia japonica TaxID=1529436 RepID=UPI001425AA92|nr:T-complex protein 1 subunit theta-like [Anneissia japonica]